MSLYGNRDQKSDAPKIIVNAATGETGTQQYGNTVFAVDATETGVSGIVTHAGWVRRTVGSGGRSGRVFMETIVASGSINTDSTSFSNTSTANVANTTGTADDTIFPDA